MDLLLETIFKPQIFWVLWTLLLVSSLVTIFWMEKDTNNRFKALENKKEDEIATVKQQLNECLAKNEEFTVKINALNSDNKKVDSNANLTSGIDEFFSSFAIEVWRLEKRTKGLNQLVTESKEFNSLNDQLQRIKDVLSKNGIETQEFTGENYNDGMSFKVLHVEEISDLPKGAIRIVETVKPTVYLKGKVIYHGEIIIGKSKTS